MHQVGNNSSMKLTPLWSAGNSSYFFMICMYKHFCPHFATCFFGSSGYRYVCGSWNLNLFIRHLRQNSNTRRECSRLGRNELHI